MPKDALSIAMELMVLQMCGWYSVHGCMHSEVCSPVYAADILHHDDDMADGNTMDQNIRDIHDDAILRAHEQKRVPIPCRNCDRNPNRNTASSVREIRMCKGADNNADHTKGCSSIRFRIQWLDHIHTFRNSPVCSQHIQRLE